MAEKEPIFSTDPGGGRGGESAENLENSENLEIVQENEEIQEIFGKDHHNNGGEQVDFATDEEYVSSSKIVLLPDRRICSILQEEVRAF